MFERGDLLLVPFPFSDLSATKRRPVLALTGPDSFGDFIALPVTSRPQSEHGLPLALMQASKKGIPPPSFPCGGDPSEVSHVSGKSLCRGFPTDFPTGIIAHRCGGVN